MFSLILFAFLSAAQDQLVSSLNQRGLANVKIVELNGQALAKREVTPPFTLDLNIVVLEGTRWTKDIVEKHLKTMDQLLMQ